MWNVRDTDASRSTISFANSCALPLNVEPWLSTASVS
jgi:hypothetical protein